MDIFDVGYVCDTIILITHKVFIHHILPYIIFLPFFMVKYYISLDFFRNTIPCIILLLYPNIKCINFWYLFPVTSTLVTLCFFYSQGVKFIIKINPQGNMNIHIPL